MFFHLHRQLLPALEKARAVGSKALMVVLRQLATAFEVRKIHQLKERSASVRYAFDLL